MTKRILLLSILLLTAAVAACGGEEPAAPADSAPEMMEITLSMGYVPDPQFAPIYVAQEKGYFAEEGFDVTFDYSFETDGVTLVGTGEEPFTLASGDVVLSARAEEVPVLYVMEWYQQYPIALVAPTSENISTPADLVGRTVGIPGQFGASYVGYSGLLAANGIAPEEILLEEVGFNQTEALLTEQVDAAVVYINNEPIQLRAEGVELTMIDIDEYVDLVATGLVTNESFAAEHPERVAGFVRAFTRGLADTLADPDEAFAVSADYIEDLSPARRPVLDASLDLWRADQLGYTDPASWQATAETLVTMGFLDEVPADIDTAYTNEFLPTAE